MKNVKLHLKHKMKKIQGKSHQLQTFKDTKIHYVLIINNIYLMMELKL